MGGNARGTSTSSSARRRRTPAFLLLPLAAGLVAATLGGSSQDRRSQALNEEIFVPFRIVAKEPVSPTSFILTVEPAAAAARLANCAMYEQAWAHGMWSAEIKQPQLQIARDYTPLPPPLSDSRDVDDDGGGRLRFLVRRYERGEVSTYLSRLGPGDEVELRGPHLGFDVRRRLGGAGDTLVFLAGGTGIAPALQAARAVLEGGEGGEAPVVSIVWANRTRADCVGCPAPRGIADRAPQGWWPRWKQNGSGTRDEGGEREERESMTALPGPIVQQLREMQARHGDRLRVSCTVDEEKSFIRPQLIAETVAAVHSPSSASSTGGHARVSLSPQCPYHADKPLERMDSDNGTPSSPPAASGQQQLLEDHSPKSCSCAGDGRGAGRNLLVVSGPEGFVKHLAGPKVWADGKELQGPLSGVLAELRRKQPGLLGDFMVLKL